MEPGSPTTTKNLDCSGFCGDSLLEIPMTETSLPFKTFGAECAMYFVYLEFQQAAHT